MDCPRRFQLRYVEAQAWPAVQAEPLLEHERHMERGARFHRLVERHQLGVDPAMLVSSVNDPDLTIWWQAYLVFDYLHKLEGRRYPEFTLSAEIAGVRLQAKYDLLVVSDRVVIFDWKTYRKVPSRDWFLSRLQTRVYPYLAVRSGSLLFGGELRADQVSMVYWVAGDPVVFEYSSAQFDVDQAYLSQLVLEILALDVGQVWQLTSDESRCRFCVYRSLCGRGGVAGQVEEWLDVDSELLVSLEDVEEVGF